VNLEEEQKKKKKPQVTQWKCFWKMLDGFSSPRKKELDFHGHTALDKKQKQEEVEVYMQYDS
jgi:hypothetical protein